MFGCFLVSHLGIQFLQFLQSLKNPHLSNFVYSVLAGCLAPKEGPTTFACNSQECLWQDWYISVFKFLEMLNNFVKV